MEGTEIQGEGKSWEPTVGMSTLEDAHGKEPRSENPDPGYDDIRGGTIKTNKRNKISMFLIVPKMDWI